MSVRPVYTSRVVYRLAKEIVKASIFQEEVSIAGKLGKSQISPRLFSQGIQEDGRGFMIMEAFDMNLLQFSVQPEFRTHRVHLATQIINLLSQCIFNMSLFNSDVKPANIVVRNCSLPVLRIIDVDPYFCEHEIRKTVDGTSFVIFMDDISLKKSFLMASIIVLENHLQIYSRISLLSDYIVENMINSDVFRNSQVSATYAMLNSRFFKEVTLNYFKERSDAFSLIVHAAQGNEEVRQRVLSLK